MMKKMKVIFIVRLLALMCEIKSMHELTREFNTDEAIENLKTATRRYAKRQITWFSRRDDAISLPFSEDIVDVALEEINKRF